MPVTNGRIKRDSWSVGNFGDTSPVGYLLIPELRQHSKDLLGGSRVLERVFQSHGGTIRKFVLRHEIISLLRIIKAALIPGRHAAVAVPKSWLRPRPDRVRRARWERIAYHPSAST